MIMIRENCPRFQLPAEFRSDLEQAAMQNGQSPFAREMMLPQIRARRDKVSPAHTEAMLGRVWSRSFLSGHEMQGGDFGLRWQAERDTAFVRATEVETSMRLVRLKAPSPLRSAGAVHDCVHCAGRAKVPHSIGARTKECVRKQSAWKLTLLNLPNLSQRDVHSQPTDDPSAPI
jgi:hypothetical protein